MLLDDPDYYVDFLCKNNLSTNQFLLLYLLYHEKMIKDPNGKLKYTIAGNIYKWLDKGKGWTEAEIEDLISKDYVVSVAKGDYSIDQLVLTNKFVDIMFISTGDAFEELLELYPPTVTIDGKGFMLKACDLEACSKAYLKAIKNSNRKHKEVLELIEYGIENKLINIKIDKFIGGKIWEDLRRLKEKDNGTTQFGREIY
jgi:hypothetical protein